MCSCVKRTRAKVRQIKRTVRPRQRKDTEIKIEIVKDSSKNVLPKPAIRVLDHKIKHGVFIRERHLGLLFIAASGVYSLERFMIACPAMA